MLISILSIPFDWLLEYTFAMGATLPRLAGIAYGVLAYGLVLFFWWTIAFADIPCGNTCASITETDDSTR